MTRLIEVNESEFSYDFDGDANRISQGLNDCLSGSFVYDGPNAILDLNAIGQVTEAYVHFPGIDQPIERITVINDEPRQRQVYHHDGLGSVIALTDDGYSTLKSYAYRAFGKIRAETGLGLNRYTYTARESIGDTQDLMYYRYRVLSTRAGRFSSFDPLGFVDGINKFRYVKNNAIIFTDPLGLVAACYRPVDGSGWMGPAAVFWHAYVEYSDGSTEGSHGPERGNSRWTNRRDGEKSPGGSGGGGNNCKPCREWTDEEVEQCVRDQMQQNRYNYTFFSNNCGDQVRNAFISCCLKDPTPWWLIY